MKLSQDEAVCLVLELAQNKTISSPTKLNKLLARLNLHFIPIDINFTLNKFGSFKAELVSLETNDFFGVEQYTLAPSKQSRKFVLKLGGDNLYRTIIKPKLDKILTTEDFELLREEIETLSTLKADEIAENEHKKLLVDVEDRYKLEQTINATFCDMYDLFEKLEDISDDTMASISLRALVEYCYYLMKYIKEVRFKQISKDYDYEGYMFDYYFLYNIRQIMPFIKEQVQKKDKDKLHINKYYQYFVNSVNGEKYPFSLENKNLNKLIAI